MQRLIECAQACFFILSTANDVTFRVNKKVELYECLSEEMPTLKPLLCLWLLSKKASAQAFHLTLECGCSEQV